VSTSDDQTVAVGHSVEAAEWAAETDRLFDRMAGRFVRVETRRRARSLLFGLLADLPRKNCWTIAEHAGERDPHGMQHFLARASWDTDGVRDDLREYVIGALGETDAVLVVDETGDLKKGSATVGVQRQYTGTAGRIENAQVAVYLIYASTRGHAMIDRELYLPHSWSTDPRRLDAAGVPAGIEFATKPALAAGMLTAALRADTPARWLTGDEVYGADPTLHAECELHRLGYVLAIGCDRRIPTAAGPTRADALAARLPWWAWQRLSAGHGAKGERIYEWAWIDYTDHHTDRAQHGDLFDTQCWSLLIRRHRHTGELAFYRCYSPEPVPLRELVRVAGRRWAVEEAFQAGKGLAGLDEHQVRRWTSWYRWTLLAMIAYALLAVIAATAANARPNPPAPNDMIALTCAEIRRLFTILIVEPARILACPLAWSHWRRRHQHQARTSHYRRQETDPPTP
jgi:SRSO17 transposase